jgi:hypothetical protein
MNPVAERAPQEQAGARIQVLCGVRLDVDALQAHAARMVDRVVPSTWTTLRSWEQLRRYGQRQGVVVILDDYTPSHFHHPGCADVRQEHFETKRRNRWANGAYYWTEKGADTAGFATACQNCGGQRGVSGTEST